MSALETYPEYIEYTADATEEVIAARMDICNSCEFLNETSCIQCACNIPVKVKSPRATCPIDKW